MWQYAEVLCVATEHIRVETETWRELNSMKDPGDTFDDVITRLIEEHNND